MGWGNADRGSTAYEARLRENIQLIERLAGAQRGRHSGVLTVHGPAAKLEIHLVEGSPAYVGSALGGRAALEDHSVELIDRALDWNKAVMAFTPKHPSVLRASPSRLTLERVVTRAIREHFDDYHSGVRPAPQPVPASQPLPGRRVEADDDAKPPPPVPSSSRGNH